VENEHLMFDRLLSANLTYQQLHNLQPDVSQWVLVERVGLHNCPQMVTLWHARAIPDFKADLGNIMGMRWSPEVMLRVGVTYRDLVELGLSCDTMQLFSHITLLGWSQLGFTRDDAKEFPEAAITRVFRMPKPDVLRSLRSRQEMTLAANGQPPKSHA
jgi:hypothetical protein